MAKLAREMVEKAGHGRGHGQLPIFALCRPYRALHEKFQIPGAYTPGYFMAPLRGSGGPVHSSLLAVAGSNSILGMNTLTRTAETMCIAATVAKTGR